MPRTTSRIQSELKQRKPFRSIQQEAGLALLRTADVVKRRIAQVIEPHGVTLQQYNVLRILQGAGKDGIPTLEIAERMIEQTPGITRLLDRLEAKGMVRRERCPSDRRQVLCWITAAGGRVLEGLEAPILEADRYAIGALEARELERLVQLLDGVREEVE